MTPPRTVPAQLDGRNLGALFLSSAARYPANVACDVSGRSVSYEELSAEARRLAAAIREQGQDERSGGAPMLLAASRSFAGYVGVLASLLAGCGYVPINPAWPTARVHWLFDRVKPKFLTVDRGYLESIAEVIDALSDRIVVGLPECDAVDTLRARWPRHVFLGRAELNALVPMEHSASSPESMAYVMFTSGSTGVPKGVCIRHAASLATNEAMATRYRFDESDRFTQLSDFSWDPSVVDMFLSWRCGARVCCPSAKEAFIPDRFIDTSEATVTHLVPTSIRNLMRAGRLKPGRFPHLRHVFVGGEPFPHALARAMQEAAPNATIVNIYGSQEYSIFSTFDWSSDLSPDDWPRGILPLGTPFEGSRWIVVGGDPADALHAEGELCVAGPQLFSGYFEDDAASDAARWNGSNSGEEPFYRTGDRVRRQNGDILYLGRRDSLVKIAGIRVDLAEIEAVLRRVAGTESAVVLAWSPDDKSPLRIAAFVADTVETPERIRDALNRELPTYMRPGQLTVLSGMPRNANGKCDRKALLDGLRTGGRAF